MAVRKKRPFPCGCSDANHSIATHYDDGNHVWQEAVLKIYCATDELELGHIKEFVDYAVKQGIPLETEVQIDGKLPPRDLFVEYDMTLNRAEVVLEAISEPDPAKDRQSKVRYAITPKVYCSFDSVTLADLNDFVNHAVALGIPLSVNVMANRGKDYPLKYMDVMYVEYKIPHPDEENWGKSKE